MPIGRLDDYPNLARWHGQQRGDGPADTLLRAACDALVGGPESLGQWLDVTESTLTMAGDPSALFESAQKLAHSLDADLMEIYSELGEEAVLSGRGRRFGEAMHQAAELTGIISLRFLAAWAALNSGDLDRCVEECERAGEDYAPLNTIRGQALLEQGKAREAIRYLSVAVKQDPGEILAWFQLAKACHVLSRHDAAWSALLQCRRLAPQSAEVALFLSMVAITDAQSGPLKAPLAWDALHPWLARYRGQPDVVMNLMRLAALLGDERRFNEVLGAADWERLVHDPDFLRLIPGVLRGLERRGWMAAARDLLVKTTGHLESVG